MKKSNSSFISNEFLFAILDNTPFGILALSRKGKIRWINDQAIDFLGITVSQKELLDTLVLDCIKEPSELRRLVKEKLLSKKKAFDLEGNFHNKRYLTFRGRVINEGLFLTIADITNVKKSEFLALNSIIEGQEMERKRIARELHDGIGPLLSTLKIKLSNIEGELLGPGNEDLQARFANSYRLIDEASDDLRSISHNLLPKVLLDFGLIEALESLADKIRTTKNIEITYIFTGSPQRFDQVVELGIYRVCQELINNTLKHARAKSITLQLVKLEHMLRIIYEDNGVGFNPLENRPGLGIMNIENRINALRGVMNIDSLPRKGMTAMIEVPYSLPADDAN
jgi:signal transduction histidine kinase